jgi:hypothetical protein
LKYNTESGEVKGTKSYMTRREKQETERWVRERSERDGNVGKMIERRGTNTPFAHEGPSEETGKECSMWKREVGGWRESNEGSRRVGGERGGFHIVWVGMREKRR